MSNNCDDDNANLLLLGLVFFHLVFLTLGQIIKGSEKRKKKIALSNSQHKYKPDYLFTKSSVLIWKHVNPSII